jgi:hypothetical protein
MQTAAHYFLTVKEAIDVESALELISTKCLPADMIGPGQQESCVQGARADPSILSRAPSIAQKGTRLGLKRAGHSYGILGRGLRQLGRSTEYDRRGLFDVVYLL